MELLLTKLTIYFMLGVLAIALIKIGNVWLIHRLTREKAYQYYNKAKRQEQQDKRVKQQLELEDILHRADIEPFYQLCRELFHDAIQSRRLTHEQILYLKQVINDSLGDYANNFKYKHFDNDAHEIYTKLKSSHISIPDFKRFIQLVKAFEATTDNTFLTVLDPNKDFKK